mgnify:CR=1 FL=1
MPNKKTPKPNNQVGGTHYSDLTIEPIQFIEANGLGYCEGNIIKYISRWKNKNGVEDIRKAAWYVNRLLQVELASQEAAQETISTRYMEDLEKAHANRAEQLKMLEGWDLQWFGWDEMSEHRKQCVTAIAEKRGLTVVEYLTIESQSSTTDGES